MPIFGQATNSLSQQYKPKQKSSMLGGYGKPTATIKQPTMAAPKISQPTAAPITGSNAGGGAMPTTSPLSTVYKPPTGLGNPVNPNASDIGQPITSPSAPLPARNVGGGSGNPIGETIPGPPLEGGLQPAKIPGISGVNPNESTIGMPPLSPQPVAPMLSSVFNPGTGTYQTQDKMNSWLTDIDKRNNPSGSDQAYYSGVPGSRMNWLRDQGYR